MTEVVIPETIAQAIELLAQVEGSTPLAGGTSIMAMKNSGVLDVPRLVALGRISEMHGILSSGEGTTLRALVRLDDVAQSATTRAVHPHLSSAAAVVGNVRVRAQATIGGAVAHADPRQDVLPALIVSGANAVITGSTGQRIVKMSDMFVGLLETVVAADEIITEVLLPNPPPDTRSRYFRFAPGSLSDFPTVSVAVSACLAGDGSLSALSIALGSVASTPITVVTDPLVGRAGDASTVNAAIDLVRASISPVSDGLGSADYKYYMAGVITGRLLCDILAVSPDRVAERLI